MNKFLELKMLNEVKLKYPQFDWLDEPTEVQYDEDDFLMDTDSLFELEKSVKNRSLIYQQVPGNTIIYDLSVAPEVEYRID